MHFSFRRPFYVLFALVVPCCRCQPPIEIHKTPEQRARDALPRVTCASRRMRAVFGPLVRHNLHIRDRTGMSVPVPKAKEQCGVWRGSENGSLSFFSRYDSCYSQAEGDTVVVSLGVQLTTGEQWYRVNISCPLPRKALKKAVKSHITPTAPPGQCEINKALQVACGPQHVSGDACFKLGCCYDAQNFTCYYRMNACSQDGHFVFWVRASDAYPPINPSSLVVNGQPQCSPVVTTPDTAVFKVGVTDCGTKMKMEGDVISYELEVEELETSTSSKHSPFSLQVQCQYEASNDQQHKDLHSLSPTINPPPVTALGSVRVQMRIATDESFTSFLSGDQLPLTLSLRKPVYVEVSIAPPDLSLRVRDCFAYPASRHSVWTLLYDGCPNPLDNMRSSIPKNGMAKTTSHSQVRRFNVKTFAFLDPETGHPSMEEMYFYCWVEICTEDTECAQRCSIPLSDGERQRRDSDSQQAQLVSFGPLLFGQRGTGPEKQPVARLGTVLEVSLYTIAVICPSIVFILLFSAWRRMRRASAEQTHNVTEEESRHDYPSQDAEQPK